MKMFKSAVFILSVLIVGLFLTSCGSEQSETPNAEEPVYLKVHISSFISVTPIFIAEQEGYFAEQNLEIEFVKYDAAGDVVALLASGQVDVSAAGLSSGLINAIARDQKIRVVADRGNFDPNGCTYSALLVSKMLLESGEITDPSDLAGKPIRSTTTGPTAFLLDNILTQYGLTLEDTETINIPQQNVGDSLSDGSIYAASVAEPYVTSIEQSGDGVIWYRGEEVVPHAVYGVLVYGSKMLEEERDAGNRFMVAYLKGVRQYNEGKTERNMELFQEFTQLDYEVLNEMCLPSISQDGRIDFETGFNAFQQWSLEKGHIDALLTQEDYFDASFVDYANQYLEENAP